MTTRANQQTNQQTRSVCFVSPCAFGLFDSSSKITFGGSEVQFYSLARVFAAQKHHPFHVSMLVADEGQSVATYDGVTVYPSFSLQRSVFNYFKGPFALYRALCRINPDVVIQRGAGPETGICAFYCSRHKKKFIYSVAHEIDVDGSYTKRGIAGKLYAYGLSHADTIVYQHRDQRKMLGRDGPVIPSAYKIPQEPVRGKKRTHILWVARSDSWKRPLLFIELAKCFPQQKFVMVMPKSSDEKTWREANLAAASVLNLELIPGIPFEKIQAYFSSARIFVNTSQSEGFPNTFIQATMAGTPIASLSINPEGMLDGVFGHCAGGSFDVLCERISHMLRGRSLEIMGKKAYEYALKRHDIASIAKHWRALF